MMSENCKTSANNKFPELKKMQIACFVQPSYFNLQSEEN